MRPLRRRRSPGHVGAPIMPGNRAPTPVDSRPSSLHVFNHLRNTLLGIDEGEPVTQALRLRLLDGMPTMLERTTFVDPVGRLLFDVDLDRGSVYAYLAERGVEL